MAIKSEAENASSSRTIPRGVYANCILAIDKLLENYDIKDEIQSALKYSYIYPEQSKGGEQVVEVTNMVRKAYAAYKDLNTFIADPTKDLLDGIEAKEATEALRKAGTKLSIKTKVVSRI